MMCLVVQRAKLPEGARGKIETGGRMLGATIRTPEKLCPPLKTVSETRQVDGHHLWARLHAAGPRPQRFVPMCVCA